MSVANRLKSQAESVEGAGECRCSINEERGLLDLLLFAEFAEEQHGELRVSRLKQPCMGDFSL